nr:hypothetical protein CFP56_61170 [Quercus suber]
MALNDRATQAKPIKAQNEFIQNLVKLTKQSSWEVGEGSESHGSTEKTLTVPLSTSEMGGVPPRSNRCMDDIAKDSVSSAGPQTNEGSVSLASPVKPLMGVPSTDEIGVDILRSDGYVDMTGADSGNTAIVADGPIVDCLFFGDVPNPDGLSDGLSNGQSDYAEPVASPKMVSQPLSVYEFSNMNHNHKLLVQNCFSPLYELDF